MSLKNTVTIKFDKLIIIFFLIFFSKIFSQNFEGTIVDPQNSPLENIAIYAWKSKEKSELLSYTYSNSKGKFELPYSKLTYPFFLEISCVFCESKVFEIQELNTEFKTTITYKEIDLEEVEIVDSKKIIEKNDTTSYEVKKFLNGTEKKVEDLLKKLPGISVNETTGQIKFKGKDIELVQLDSDDLFGANYTLGTKNISIDMVEEIQAIENFSTNPLFKGVEDSEKTILNLKLKKNKFDFSNDVVLRNGYGEKYMGANEITTLGVNKFIKSFGIIAFQNFGINSIDYRFDEIENYDTRFCNEEFKTTKNISESNFFNQLPAKRTNFNESIFASFNSMFKISRRIKVKSNLNYFSDKFDFSELIETNYFENNQLNQQFIQENNYYRNPKILKIYNQLTFNVNKHSLLEYKINWFNENIDSGIHTLLNSENYNSTINTNNHFLKSDLEYTYKINNNNVFKIDHTISFNSIPQLMLSNPGNIFESNINSSTNKQNSVYQNRVVFSKFKYLFKINEIKNVLFVGYSDKKLPFQSSLIQDDLLNSTFSNDVNYSIRTLFSEFTTSFKIKNSKTRIFISSNHYNQILKSVENPNIKKTELALNYSIISNFNLSNSSSIIFNYEVQNNTPNQNNLYSNFVSTDNTSIRNNIISLDLAKNERAVFTYKFKNMNKLFLVDLNINYNNSTNSNITNIIYNSNFISYTSFQTPHEIESKKIDLNIDKYLKPLKINLKCNVYHSIDSYFNSITDFELRENKLKDTGGSIYLISTFNLPINFESKFNYINSSTKSNDGFESKRESLSSVFNLIVKPSNNTILKTSYEFYKFDLNQKVYFSFLDTNIQFNNKKNNFSFSIQCNNLLNENLFRIFSNNDYSTTIYQSKLLSRYALLLFSFKI